MAVNFPYHRVGAKGLILYGLGQGTTKPVNKFMAHLLRIQIYTADSVKINLCDFRVSRSDMLTQGGRLWRMVFNRTTTC